MIENSQIAKHPGKKDLEKQMNDFHHTTDAKFTGLLDGQKSLLNG